MVMKRCQASTVIEMAYLMPVVLLVWAFVIYLVLFFHDKVLISAAAYETAVVGSEIIHEEDEIDAERLEFYFSERIHRKLLFFRSVSVVVEKENNQIVVTSGATRKWMVIEVVQSAAITEPEKQLRKIKMIKDGLEGVLQ